MPSKKYRMNFALIAFIIAAFAVLWSLGSWLVVRTIEEPRYVVVEKRNGYEIRDYAPYIVAEVEVSGSRDVGLNKGFRLLADYIF